MKFVIEFFGSTMVALGKGKMAHIRKHHGKWL